MTSSELRAEARKNLTGKWGKAAIAVLVFMLITFVIGFVLGLIPVVGSIASYVISPVLSFGFIVTMLKLKRGEEITYTEFLSNGFNSFGRVWAVIGWTLLKMVVPVIILVISIFILGIGAGMSAVGSSAGTVLLVLGVIAYIVSLIYTIIKGYLFVLANFVLADNENMSGKEAVEESAKLMQGHRWAYFWLNLSFIGWAMLAAFTFGIGYLWLMPYMQIATIAFYESLSEKKDAE